MVAYVWQDLVGGGGYCRRSLMVFSCTTVYAYRANGSLTDNPSPTHGRWHLLMHSWDYVTQGVARDLQRSQRSCCWEMHQSLLILKTGKSDGYSCFLRQETGNLKNDNSTGNMEDLLRAPKRFTITNNLKDKLQVLRICTVHEDEKSDWSSSLVG